MRNISHLKIVMIALSFAVMIAILVWWVTGAHNVCRDAAAAVRMDIAKSNGCIEFWGNRYQSLIGNVITAGVAGITLLWVARQFDTSARQTAVASAQALRVRARELEDEGETCVKAMLLQQAIADYVAAPDAFMGMSNSHKELISKTDQLARCALSLKKAADADRESVITPVRDQYMFQINLMIGNAINARDSYFHARELMSPHSAPYRAALNGAWHTLQMIGREATPVGETLRLTIEAQTVATWRQIRAFERLAVG